MSHASEPAIVIQSVSHRYGKVQALHDVSLSIARGATVGLIGPDGVGKSTLLSLIAGVRVIQAGSVSVLGGDMADRKTRQALSHQIAYMPQGLGHNLYPTLSVYENVDFHARLFGLNAAERKARIARLLQATGLAPFPGRAAGKLSGGMKQKLSLCCALVHSPDVLILDEPTTGVDPLSRRQFWALVNELQAESPGMTVIVATAYIEEAEHFEYLLAMDEGRLLVSKPTREVMAEHGVATLEEAYIRMLPPEKQQGSGGLAITPFVPDPHLPPAIEAHGLTKRFGGFTAVDHVSFRIDKGEIFGFLGSNGCGKSTTMKMLTGLLEATEGTAELLGKPVDAGNIQTRMRVGYMSQAFSLYEELSVRQNLELHARLYQIEGAQGRQAVDAALRQFDLADVADIDPISLSLGMRQRLQLAAACLHKPEVLILDEPTSGVDPAARDMFWRMLLKLSRQDKITIFVSTHFMNEAERCDRISFMHKGRVLAVGTPQELVRRQGAENLEEAFIQYLVDEEKRAEAAAQEAPHETPQKTPAARGAQPPPNKDWMEHGRIAELLENGIRRSRLAQRLQQRVEQRVHHLAEVGAQYRASHASRTGTLAYWLATAWTFAVRESKELLRDKIRLFFAIMGPVILMATTGWSISFDVNHLPFSVLDRDQSVESRRLVEYFAGSGYFVQQPPVQAIAEADQALKSSRSKLVIDIPPHFGRDVLSRRQPEVGFYLDGSLPFNAANLQGYIGGIMTAYTHDTLRRTGLPLDLAPAASIVPRFMYNQDFRSINAVAPSVLMMALMLIPAMMTALGVVREREIGSISNLYASPASVAQYLVGKQLPYVGMGLVNYALLVLMTVLWFGVPVKGSFWAMSLGAGLLVYVSTGLGLLVSSFVRSQVAALFLTAIITLIPTINFSGLLYPLSSMSGGAYAMGVSFPASWYQRISIGGFTKGLGFASFGAEYGVLLGFALLYLLLACIFLKKQEK